MRKREQIEIRKGWTGDVFSIGRIIVETWKSAFHGILDEAFLDRLSPAEQAVRHLARRSTPGVQHFVAIDVATQEAIGFANFGPARASMPSDVRELYALYVRPSYQGRGAGAGLVRQVARHSLETGATRLYAWVLADNPNRAFYERLGANPGEMSTITLGGRTYQQVAYAWDDLEALAGRSKRAE
ncbi:GNAT family N-acetyltransferase [Sinorhizobium sp. BG8]|uniref:GNAT family N-acetyltransferase n=1 Tax=Sinorhizobium sp. BG8 TaxID=2613773 RepID=UPI00193DB239|nr:GNAT family N-acetyltransferase [Sinorhizobium sp. BG8]QRM53965.1 GNAT family N-acetyltransferase [Sinorhizobium sp. BG8]